MTRTRKDSEGRRWTYNGGEGTWSYGEFLIGMGALNGRKFANWNSDCKYPEEFKTLKEAMESC
jgi:hypothetical protein